MVKLNKEENHMRKGKEISTENYVKYAFIVIFVVIVTFIIRNIYLNKQNENNSIIAKTVSRVVKSSEVDNFLSENDTIILYIPDQNTTDEILEREIAKIIEDNELKEDIVYIDIKDVTDINKYLETFNQNHNIEGITNYPTFIYLKDGFVEDVLFTNLNSNSVEEFIKRNVKE